MKHYDVFGVGNALVDILVPTEDVFIKRLGFEKGIMTLVDSEKQAGVLAELEGSKRNFVPGEAPQTR